MPVLEVVRSGPHRAWRARWLPACAGALLALSAVGAWSLQRAEGGSPLSGIANRQVVKPVGSPVSVAWRARVNVPRAEFRVYRGPDAQHLREVATLPAALGEQEYHFSDGGGSARDAVYEVRFADAGGGEQVVARAFCARTSSMGGGFPSTDAQQDVAVIAASAAAGPVVASFCPTSGAAARTRPRPEPLDSPPRATAL